MPSPESTRGGSNAASRPCKSSGSKRSQARAGQFRSKQQCIRIIKVLDQAGSLKIIKKRGRLNITAHPSALNVLEKKALRYLNRRKTEDDRDEELIRGALESINKQSNTYIDINVNDNDSSEIQQILEEKKELLEPIGVVPGAKSVGTSRVGYQNVYGLPANISNNPHLDSLKEVADDLELDAFAFTEHRNNLKHKENRRYGLTQLFQGGEAMVRGIWSCNKHDNTEQYINKRIMEGGTGLVAFGELASCMSAANSGSDELGLGRWTLWSSEAETTTRQCFSLDTYHAKTTKVTLGRLTNSTAGTTSIKKSL